MKRDWREIVILLCLFLFSLLVRLPRLDSIFTGNDETGEVLFGTHLHNLSFLEFQGDGRGNFFAVLLASPHGFFYLFVYLVVGLLDTLKVVLNETTLRLPFVLLGSLLPLVTYRWVKSLSGRGAAFLSGLLISVVPFAVGYSREPKQLIAFPFVYVCAFDAFWKYLKKPSPMSARIASLWLAASMGMGPFLFVPICAWILSWSYVRQRQNNPPMTKVNLFRESFRAFCSFRLVSLPLFVLILYGTASLLLSVRHQQFQFYGYWGRFFSHASTPQFSLFHNAPIALRFVAFYYGLPLFILAPLGVFHGWRSFKRGTKDQALFWMTALFFSPFLFYPIEQGSKFWYLFLPLFFLMLLTAAALAEFLSRWRRMGCLMIGLGVLGSGITTMSVIYQFPSSMPKVPPTYGSVTKETGIKTAGYFVRSTLRDGERIECDLETVEMIYYLGRWIEMPSSVRQAWLRRGKNYRGSEGILSYKEWLTLNQPRTPEFIYVKDPPPTPANIHEGEVLRLEGGRYLACVIRYQGRPISYFTSKEKRSLVILDTEKWNKRFDERFGSLDDLKERAGINFFVWVGAF